MNIAVIPARGGSKRIPKKNIRNFAGSPIISYSINAAKESGIFEKIIVSTDDLDIASVAEKYGAEVPFIRPSEISDDFTGTHQVVSHAIKELTKQGLHYDYACCIYATAPFIRPDEILKGFQIIQKSDYHAVLAATQYSYPVYRSFTHGDKKGLKMLFPEHYHSRSQDLEEVMHDAGQFYWADIETWLSEPKGFGKNTEVVLLPAWRVQDIDTLDDWKRAEQIASLIEDAK